MESKYKITENVEAPKAEEPKAEEPKTEDNKYMKLVMKIGICVCVVFFLALLVFTSSLIPEKPPGEYVMPKPPHSGPEGYVLDLENHTREIIVPEPEPKVVESGVQQELVLTPNETYGYGYSAD